MKSVGRSFRSLGHFLILVLLFYFQLFTSGPQNSFILINDSEMFTAIVRKQNKRMNEPTERNHWRTSTAQEPREKEAKQTINGKKCVI